MVSFLSFVWRVRVVVPIDPVISVVPNAVFISFAGIFVIMKEEGISILSNFPRPSVFPCVI